MPAPSYCNCKH